MTNREVVKAWKGYKSGNAGHLHTNGNLLYSYGLEIGYKGNAGELFVIDYTTRCGANNFQVAGYGYFHVTQTTSRHVNIATSVADFVVNPLTQQARVNNKFRNAENESARDDPQHWDSNQSSG